MSSIVNKLYDDMLTFIQESGDSLKVISKNLAGQSDDPEEYVPLDNIKLIESLYIKDRQFAQDLINMGKRLQKNKSNEKRTEELTKIYVETVKYKFTKK